MKKNTVLTEREQDLDSESILPQIPEIFTDERKGYCLVLNPLGPWWFVGSKLHADFARLCDGKRSLREIRESLSDYSDLTDEHMVLLAKSLQKANFFIKTEKKEILPLSIVFFNITSRCNLKCPYCYYDSVPVNSESEECELTADQWVEFAGKIAAINPNARIVISGGEPLLRADAISIIENITEKYDLKVKLVTNGTLFTDGMIERFSKIKNFSVQVSIDSIIPELNEKTRGKGSLHKSLEAVQKMKAAGINFIISSTITKLNVNTIRGFREYCKKNHYDFRSSVFTPSGYISKSNRDWLELSPEEYFDASTYALEDFKPETTMGHPMVPGLRRYGCGMGYGQMDISPDGSVHTCSHLIKPQFNIGNIQTSDLHELINEGKRRFIYCEVDNLPYCTENKCPVRYFCAGGCRANSFNTLGTIDTHSKNCEQYRKSYIGALWVSLMGPDYLKEDTE
jgi:radical SAM protein with 4Fe4S-binding SPASM domain